MKYFWQHPTWPNYEFDPVAGLEAQQRYQSGSDVLTGSVSVLKDDDQYDAYVELMLSEAISTSAIEGETLDRESVRSSLRNYLNLTGPNLSVRDEKVLGISALMVDVRRSVNIPLNHKILFAWQKMVIPEGGILNQPLRGLYRTSSEPMVIASGPIGYHKVHYEAPPASEVHHQMDLFLQWYNRTAPVNGVDSIPSPTRSAIAHLWFESVHPFEDGNGRVGRAIAEHALGQSLQHPPLLSISSVVELDRAEYYNQLEQAQRSSNVTPWVEYFSNIIADAQSQATEKVSHILGKSRFWDSHKDKNINERQHKVINKVFDAGVNAFEQGVSAKKYQAMANCSKPTATRDLSNLLAMGVLTKREGSGRNTRYDLDVPKHTLVNTVRGQDDYSSS